MMSEERRERVRDGLRITVCSCGGILKVVIASS